MGRKRKYSSAAERQKAYRIRKGEQQEAVQPATKPTAKQRPLSRPKRLALVVNEVQALLCEYEDWRDSLPPSLAESEQYEEIEETVDLLIQAAEPLGMIQPPLGFGRTRK